MLTCNWHDIDLVNIFSRLLQHRYNSHTQMLPCWIISLPICIWICIRQCGLERSLSFKMQPPRICQNKELVAITDHLSSILNHHACKFCLGKKTIRTCIEGGMYGDVGKAHKLDKKAGAWKGLWKEGDWERGAPNGVSWKPLWECSLGNEG